MKNNSVWTVIIAYFQSFLSSWTLWSLILTSLSRQCRIIDSMQQENLMSALLLISSCFLASCALSSLQVNLALKQKSDIEHYRNKLRLKAKRKGYYDFPSTDGSSSGRAVVQRQRHGHERAAGEHGRPLEPDDERGSTYVKSHRRWEESGKAGGTWVWLSVNTRVWGYNSSSHKVLKVTRQFILVDGVSNHGQLFLPADPCLA